MDFRFEGLVKFSVGRKVVVLSAILSSCQPTRIYGSHAEIVENKQNKSNLRISWWVLVNLELEKAIAHWRISQQQLCQRDLLYPAVCHHKMTRLGVFCTFDPWLSAQSNVIWWSPDYDNRTCCPYASHARSRMINRSLHGLYRRRILSKSLVF